MWISEMTHARKRTAAYSCHLVKDSNTMHNMMHDMQILYSTVDALLYPEMAILKEADLSCVPCCFLQIYSLEKKSRAMERHTKHIDMPSV